MKTRSSVATTACPRTLGGRFRTACATRLLTLLMLTASAAKADMQYGNFTYTSSGTAVTITRYTGPGGAVTIPSTVNGLPVTGIGSSAFMSLSLTSVTIPDTVNVIEDSAFSGCTNLSGATLGASISRIRDYAFMSCTSLTSITLPNSLTNIGFEAFGYCTSLTNMAIPPNVSSIGSFAFIACTSLNTITVDALNSVYSSVDGVLFNKSQTLLVQCPGGKAGSYLVPATVTSLGNGAFMGCATLASVTLPSGVTSLGSYAFASCIGLPGVYFQGNAPDLGSSVFDGSYSTTAYYLPVNTGWGTIFAGRPALPWHTESPVGCVSGLSPSTGDISGAGGAGTFSVTSAGGCAWSAVGNRSWLHTTNCGTGNGAVTFTVDPNPDTTPRTGAIIVGTNSFMVNQSGLCTYALSPASTNVSAGSGAGSFAVSASGGCGWTAVPTAGWLHTSSSGTGNGVVDFTVDANTSKFARSAAITVGGQTFTVNQPLPCTYALGPTSTNVSAGPGAGSFTVLAGDSCAWAAATTNDWLHTPNSGAGNGVVNYAVDANTSGIARTGTIVLGGQTFTIMQSGPGWVSNLTFGPLWDTGTGWYGGSAYGWMWFHPGGQWIWSSSLRGWLAITDPGSRTLWSTQFRWLTPSATDAYRADTTAIGAIYVGQHHDSTITDGWVVSDRFGYVWANGDGKWFYSTTYGWLGVTDTGGIWCVNLGKFL